MSDTPKTSPWRWVPTLYMAESLPYALVTNVAVVLYNNLGLNNSRITFWLFFLGLPWVIKPLWSPVVERLHTRRQWIWPLQILMGALLAGVALALPVPHFFQITLALFFLLALASATHDVAADGFYILALPEREQAAFSGVRNTFYRLATIAAQGALVVLAGRLQRHTGSFATAWLLTLLLPALALLTLGGFHGRKLPRPPADVTTSGAEPFFAGCVATFRTFFQKPKILTLLAFLLLFRFGEAHLTAMTKLFLLNPREQGGLALSNEQYGLIYGVFGVSALLAGGLLGGYVISRRGLKFWLWPMLLAIHLPNALFLWLAWAQPQNLFPIGAGIVLEQFGYGFGFTAFMLYMIYIARGPHSTAHYALCTGFMALGLNLPNLWSGWLQEHIGYLPFFIWVLLATIPSFWITARIPLDTEFGRKE